MVYDVIWFTTAPIILTKKLGELLQYKRSVEPDHVVLVLYKYQIKFKQPINIRND